MLKSNISSLLVLLVLIAVLIFIPLSMRTVVFAGAPAPPPFTGIA